MKKSNKIKITEHNKGRHIAIAGDINSILASKKDTDGTYSIIEITVFPNGGPRPHIQTREHEGFYILDGVITFNIEGKEITAKTGTYVNVPPHIIHSFHNNTNKTAKMLVVLVPGGLENLFVDVGSKVSDNSTQPSPMNMRQMKKLSKLSSKYGVQFTNL